MTAATAVLAIIVLIMAAAVLTDAPAAHPDELHNNPLRDQGSIQSRIDELAQPQPQSGQQPSSPPPTAAAPGSFPRSFLIPGTDTSIRIGGSVDGTASYYGR
jgi:hypothetical protein